MVGINQESLYKLVYGLLDTGGALKTLLNSIMHRKLYTSLKRNIELKAQQTKSEKAYVCALGPSLKQVKLEEIKGDTIVVNRFFKIGKEHPSFVPTYYIMIDAAFATEEHIKDFRQALDTYLPKGTIFLLNSKLAGTSILDGYDKNNIYFVSCFRGNTNIKKQYGVDKPMPAFQNVVCAAIFFLMQMGYKNISLLGCDFNSFASRKRIHCYKEEKSDERFLSMAWELFCYSMMARNHEDLQKYAEANGVSIINTTKDSLIDAYPYEIDESLYLI